MADRVQEYRFRGYVRRIGNRWYVNIIDLSLDAEADALPEAMQKIDDAMAKNPKLTTAQMDEVKKYRAEGEALHKAGKHQQSVDTLAKAMKLLGI